MAGSWTTIRRSPRARLVLRGVYVAAWVAVIGYLALRVGPLLRLRLQRERPAGASTERLLPNDSKYVVDDAVGWRPRGRFTEDYKVTSIDRVHRVRCVRRTDTLGLVGRGELPERPTQPVVLMIGDSHLFGIVSNSENAALLLESSLRRRPGGAETTVVNASSGYYSPYQYVLRARQLHDRVRPRLVIAVVYLGNDLIELEDLGRPHIDDRGEPRPADPAPPPETTSQRIAWLQGVAPGFFWQGLNQSAYLFQNPDRLGVIETKLGVVASLLADLGRTGGCAVLVVLLPSYELAYPQRLAALPANARAAMSYARSLGLSHRVGAIFRREGLQALDLTPAFARSTDPDLYADDYHIWRGGHALLAGEVAPAAALALGLTTGGVAAGSR